MVVKLGSPRTMSAAWAFLVGMEFQISTRLFWVSATYNFPAWIQTPCGARRLLAVTGMGLTETKSGWPSTTSAGWSITVGNESHNSTRLLAVSATATRTPSDATPKGRFMPVALVEAVVVTKSGSPKTLVAPPKHTGHRTVN